MKSVLVNYQSIKIIILSGFAISLIMSLPLSKLLKTLKYLAILILAANFKVTPTVVYALLIVVSSIRIDILHFCLTVDMAHARIRSSLPHWTLPSIPRQNNSPRTSKAKQTQRCLVQGTQTHLL